MKGLSSLRKLRRTLSGLALATMPLVAHAQEWAPLSPPQLEAVRGGFQVGGLQFDFGAVVNTYVAGQLVLQTTLTWTATGAVTGTSGVDNPTRLDPGQAAAAIAGLGLDPKAFASGAVFQGEGGITAVMQQVSSKQISSLIANTASGQSIRQETNLTLTLPGFAAVQQDFARQQSAGALAASINQALRLPTGR